ncbi:MAG: hypothetical protein D8M60_21935 [Chloroflexi bacterium]|nr:hypothetical protein [Chloroflexota bacterium]
MIPLPVLEGINLSAIEEPLSGNLWLEQGGDDHRFLVVNLSTGEYISIPYPTGCWNFIPNSTYLMCKGDDQMRYLFDPTTNIKVQTSIAVDQWYTSTPDGKLLLYQGGLDGDLGILHAFSIQDQAVEEIIRLPLTEMFPQTFARPYLSTDGRFLTVNKITGEEKFVIEIIELKSMERVEIPLKKFASIGAGSTWVPNQSKIIYGEAPGSGPGGIPPTDLYYFDIETSQLEALGSAPNNYYHLIELDYKHGFWSPAGTQFVVTTGEELCIIDIEKFKQDCYQPPLSSWWIQSPVWSPNSNQILFYSQGTLMVFDVDTEQFQILVEDIYSINMFWR